MNCVTLLGRLGKDPEIRTTGSGEKVASFSVATSEQVEGQGHGREERTHRSGIPSLSGARWPGPLSGISRRATASIWKRAAHPQVAGPERR